MSLQSDMEELNEAFAELGQTILEAWRPLLERVARWLRLR